jgi:8-oxo-dGTP diphosphatase
MRRVTAAVIIEDGRLLLARRPAGDPLAGQWELPGGKIEDGETPQCCLERELLEELEMRSVAGVLLASTTYHYDHGSFEMLALAATRLGDYRPLVHDATAWVSRDELRDYELAPADADLVGSLLSQDLWRSRL